MAKKKYGVDLPGTLERSPEKAQRTYAETLKSAEKTYGSGERAARTAYASLKHGFEKVGDHWEPKEHKGPSDAQAARSGREAREGRRETAGGVDALGHTRQELYERAKALDIAGRSTMNKEELARAIARKQR
ncbi:ChaB family protein [Caldimonas tepidiphila]|uniref:ChaB family protein n=1 Tax=Caldimonas tepidiphila TaxID=2315841 RepID=UPI000E5AE24E|nr:ChaB family protein [Caldimonas tepidiphila]